jgi:serine/threonine-protein phosphatase PP1 catalytic subunit
MWDINVDLPDFLKELIEKPEKYLKLFHTAPFTLEHIGIVSKLFVDLYRGISNLVLLEEISDNFHDVLIVGDTHGDLKSTLRIIKPFMNGKVKSILFLGDYVDRGQSSLPNLMLLAGMAIAWPKRVILLRGNHENFEINNHFGFTDELKHYYSHKEDFNSVRQSINNIYDHLSLIAITHQGSVCMHAGIPKYKAADLSFFTEIPKPHRLLWKIKDTELRQKYYDAYIQCRWNDPAPENEKLDEQARSYHGYYYYTGKEIQKFLKTGPNCKRIIKAHESLRGGYDNMYDGVCLHIFSCEPYYGHIKKAFTIHEQQDQISILRDLNFKQMREIK